MKVVYPVCCGIDVHRHFLIATIITTKAGELTPYYQKCRFSTFNNQILPLKQWLLENNCIVVCMVNTGKHWISIYNLLEDELHITAANPKWVRAIQGNKDNKKDFKLIAELFRVGLVREIFITRKDWRVLREYTRYRTRLTSHRSSEKNRLQNAFTVGNIVMESIVSDIFGVSSNKVRDYILTAKTFDPEYCVSLLHSRMKKKGDELVESIEDYSYTNEQLIRIQIIEEHKQYLDNTIDFLNFTIARWSHLMNP